MTFCTNCGKEMKAGAAQCSACGATMAASQSGISNTPSAIPSSTPSSTPSGVTSSEHDHLQTRITPASVSESGEGDTLRQLQPIGAQVGRVLGGRYQLDLCIGSGGMGEIYRARRLHIGDTVAVKVLRRDVIENEKTRQRFYREARAAAMLHHPNAVVIHDFGEDTDGTAYIVMELLVGRSLRQLLIEDGTVSPARVHGIVRQAAAALDAGHRNGIVHRDIKPDNIYLLDSNDEADHIKILDFGIAKLNDKALDTISFEEQRLTNVGTIIGTPHYMSPEQCQGEEADARSDIYSLGVVLYELLTGVVPFVAKTPTGVAIKHVTEKPKALRELNPNISPAIESAVLRAMEKEPSARPQTALDLAREFDSAIRRDRKYEDSTAMLTTGEREAAAGAVTDDNNVTAVLPPAANTSSHQKVEDSLQDSGPQNFDTFIVAPNETSVLEHSKTEYLSPSTTDVLPSAVTAQQRPSSGSKTTKAKPTEVISSLAKATEAKATEAKAAGAQAAEPAPPAPALPTTDVLRTDPFGQTQGLGKAEKKEKAKTSAMPEPVKPVALSSKFAPAVGKPAEAAHAKSRTPLFIGIGALLLLLAATGAWFLGGGKEKVETAGASANPSPAASASTSGSSSQFPQSPSQAAPEGMVYVIDGVIRLGREDGEENERPAHIATIKPFFLDQTEVTNEQYQKFVASGHAAPPSWSDGHFPAVSEKLPVTDVTWEDATAYAEWTGKRLPTEEEWEFAARGLNIKFLYPWGEDWLDNAANVAKDKNDKRQLMPVGQFPSGASPFGALDIIGNAWEWTASDYKEYPGGKIESLTGFSNVKVLRGGSYQSLVGKITATARRGWPAGRGDWPKNGKPDYGQTGFRCAKDAK